MNGDFTRLAFDPTKHLKALLKQQGRVELESDWNELIAILEHRLHEQTVDTIGGTGVPKPPGLNPALGFQISADATGKIALTQGRIYVDGLLCENGATANGYYVPPLPGVDVSNLGINKNKTALFYLDAWDRHVSVLEDPGLIERALGGPDTATRVQTAWKVGVKLDPIAPQDCTGKPDLPPASTGLLSTMSAAPTGNQPCAVGAQGGYIGLENRLYRVEVHDAQASTFKWSRDNNSVGLAIKDVAASDGTVLEAFRVGAYDRDRFVEHWVELLSDEAEYADGHGMMAKVKAVDDVGLTLTLYQDVSGLKGRSHLRIRRWDMSPSDSPKPAIQLNTWVDLEDGVRVKFGNAQSHASDYRTGDYWTFTARTVEAQVEVLNDAPPQGVVHHYCALGFVTWTTGGDGKVNTVGLKICTPTFPSLTDLPDLGQCDCCIQLDGKTDLATQMGLALQQLKLEGGGRISLPSGTYVLTKPITIDGSNISINGCAGLTRLVYQPAQNVTAPAIFVDAASAPEGVTICDLGIFGAGAPPLISFGRAHKSTLERCTVVNLPVGDNPAHAIQVAPTTVNLAIRQCDLVGTTAIFGTNDMAGSWLTGLLVERCRLRAMCVGAWLEGTYGVRFANTHVAGFASADWLALAATVGGLANTVQPLETILDGLLNAQPTAAEITVGQPWTVNFVPTALDAVRAAGLKVGGKLPIGIALLDSVKTLISDCRLDAGVALWATDVSGLAVEQSSVTGLFGVVIRHGNAVRIQGCTSATFLNGVIGGGLAWQWHVLENVIYSRTGIRIGALSWPKNVLSNSISAVGQGLGFFISGEWEPWLAGQQFDLGPAGNTGAKALMVLLQSRPLVQDLGGSKGSQVSRQFIENNVVWGADAGIDLDGAGYLEDVSVSGNTLLGCRQVAVRLQTPYSTGQHLVRGNKFDVGGRGIHAACTGIVVAANEIGLTGRATGHVDPQILQQLATAAAASVPPEPLGLSFPPEVDSIIGSALATVSGVGSGNLQLVVEALAQLRKALPGIGLDYEGTLLQFALAKLIKQDITAAVYGLVAFRSLFLSAIDTVGVLVSSAGVIVSQNVVSGKLYSSQGWQLARGGVVVDPLPVFFGSDLMATAPAGPGAMTATGSFVKVGNSGMLIANKIAPPDIGVIRFLPIYVDVTVADNHIRLGTGHGIEVRRTASGLTITGNEIIGLAGNGISFTGPMKDADNVEISRNRISKCRPGPANAFPGLAQAGILVDGGSNRRIVGNTIDQCGGPQDEGIAGIWVSGGSDVVVNGNTVTNNGNTSPNWGGWVALGCAVFVYTCSDSIQISDNRFMDNVNQGIVIIDVGNPSNPVRISVTGNQARGYTSPGIGWGFVRIAAEKGSLVCSNNDFNYPAQVWEATFQTYCLNNAISSNVISGANGTDAWIEYSLAGGNTCVVGNVASTGFHWGAAKQGAGYVFQANLPV